MPINFNDITWDDEPRETPEWDFDFGGVDTDDIAWDDEPAPVQQAGIMPSVGRGLTWPGEDEKGFFGRIGERWETGKKQLELGQLRYRQMLGEEAPELTQRISELHATMPRKEKVDRNILERAIGAAAEMAPIPLEGMRKGWERGLVLGAGAAGITALAGQAGPQVAFPEEVITVPAAFTGMFGVGAMSGAIENIGQVEAGLAYDELLELKDKQGNRIDPTIAKSAAAGVGVINGLIEIAQIKTLLRTIPGGEKLLSGAIRETTKKIIKSPSLKNLAFKYAGKYASGIGKETAQEIAQESTNILASELAKKVNNELKDTDIPAATKEQIVKRLWDTATESALAFSAFMLPGTTVSAGTEAVETRGLRRGEIDETDVQWEEEPAPTRTRTPEEQIAIIQQGYDAGVLKVPQLTQMKAHIPEDHPARRFIDQLIAKEATAEPIDLVDMVQEQPEAVEEEAPVELTEIPGMELPGAYPPLAGVPAAESAAAMERGLQFEEERLGRPPETGPTAQETANVFQRHQQNLLNQITNSIATVTPGLEDAQVQEALALGTRYGIEMPQVRQAIIEGFRIRQREGGEEYAPRIREDEGRILPAEERGVVPEAPEGEYVEGYEEPVIRQRPGEGREDLELEEPGEPGRERAPLRPEPIEKASAQPLEEPWAETQEKLESLGLNVYDKGYINITDQTDIKGLVKEYPDSSVHVKDVNGWRATFNIKDFEKLLKRPEFVDRIRGVNFSLGSHPTKIQSGFMGGAFKAEDIPKITTGKEVVEEKAEPIKPIKGIEFQNNSTISTSQQAKFINAIKNDRVRKELKERGVKNLIIDPPYKFELSEQANIDIAEKTIRVNADAENPTQSILHEIGHDDYEKLSGLEREKWEKVLAKLDHKSIQGYKKLGLPDEAYAEVFSHKGEPWADEALGEVVGETVEKKAIEKAPTVTVTGHHEKTGEAYKIEMPADQAVKNIDDQISVYEKMLDCVSA